MRSRLLLMLAAALALMTGCTPKSLMQPTAFSPEPLECVSSCRQPPDSNLQAMVSPADWALMNRAWGWSCWRLHEDCVQAKGAQQ